MANHKDYNKRKIQVLKLATLTSSGKLSPKVLSINIKITPANARNLLLHYMREELFTRPRRGTYRISKRGRDRLKYLETRQTISKATGIDIGLNHHKPLPCSIHDLLLKYQNATGQPLPPIPL